MTRRQLLRDPLRVISAGAASRVTVCGDGRTDWKPLARSVDPGRWTSCYLELIYLALLDTLRCEQATPVMLRFWR